MDAILKWYIILHTVKPVLSTHSKRRPKICVQDQLSLNVGQNYCRMLQGKHSAIMSTFIKLAFVIKIFVLSIFEWPLKTGFIVFSVSTMYKARLWSTTVIALYRIRQNHIEYLCYIVLVFLYLLVLWNSLARVSGI